MIGNCLGSNLLGPKEQEEDKTTSRIGEIDRKVEELEVTIKNSQDAKNKIVSQLKGVLVEEEKLRQQKLVQR